jgi:hypothetical protein
MPKEPAPARTPRRSGAGTKPRCGLCGKTGNLTKTECCGQWVCDDEGSYVLFSYARNSCSRNHRRYTLCGFHFNEGHEGGWLECEECRQGFETELYVYYGTNDFNFVKLANPPAFEPTTCTRCKRIIKLGTDAYSISGTSTICSACFGP